MVNYWCCLWFGKGGRWLGEVKGCTCGLRLRMVLRGVQVVRMGTESSRQDDEITIVKTKGRTSLVFFSFI